MTEELTHGLYDPLRKEDRIKALLSEHTSTSGECPYYNRSLYSRCALDRFAAMFPPCDGRSFIKGFCCQRLVDGAEQDEA
jgi:hypothetical protein